MKCPVPKEGQKPGCIILILTPLEVQALIGERGILDTAAQARPLDLGQAVRYFQSKIDTAPTGQIAEPLKTEPPK